MCDKRYESGGTGHTANRNVKNLLLYSKEKLQILLCLPVNAKKPEEEYLTMPGIS